MISIAKSTFTLIHPLRVRWAECDSQGIVFNVNYFLFYDVAMTEWLRALGFQGEGKPAIEFLTAHAQANFRAPALFDEMIEVGIRCARIGTKSMDAQCAIFRGEELLNDGAMTYVHVDIGTKNSSPVPDAFIDRIQEFENTAPVMERRS